LRDTALFLSGMVVLRCANAPYTEMSGTPAEVKMEMPPRVVVAAPPAVSEMATSLGTRTIHTTTSTQGADAVAETRTITPPRRRGRKRLRPLTPPMQELLLSQDEVVTSTQLLVPTSSPTQCLVPAESATPPSTLEMQPVAIKTTSEPADVASGVPPAIVAAMDELSPSSQDDALDLSPSATTSAEDAGEASATSTTPLAMMVAAPTVRRGRSRMGEAERGEQHYATMKYTGHGLVPLEEIRACQGGGGGDALHHTSASYLHVVRQTCKRLATTTTTTTTTTTRPRTWLHTALHQIDDVWRGASSVRGGMLHGACDGPEEESEAAPSRGMLRKMPTTSSSTQQQQHHHHHSTNCPAAAVAAATSSVMERYQQQEYLLPTPLATTDDHLRAGLYHLLLHPPSAQLGSTDACQRYFHALQMLCPHQRVGWERVRLLLQPGDLIHHGDLYPADFLLPFSEFLNFVEIASVRYRAQRMF